jgi:glutaconate CoA-transferase subunit A
MTHKVRSLEDAAKLVADGDQVVMSGGMSASPMAMLRALAKRRARGLRAVGVVGGALNMDFLCGAGALSSIDTCSVSFNPIQREAPNFLRAIQTGQIRMFDNT